MTVTELVTNFRAGLLGLLPSIEYVGIPWKRPDAYDEWDNLATAVYRALIVEPLRYNLPKPEQERFSLVDYDMLIPSYVGKSVIEVLPQTSDGDIHVFHALGTSKAPFDIVEWRPVDPTGSPQSDLLRIIPFEDVRFALRLYKDGFSTTRIE